jgi:hypothetical protein
MDPRASNNRSASRPHQGNPAGVRSQSMRVDRSAASCTDLHDRVHEEIYAGHQRARERNPRMQREYSTLKQRSCNYSWLTHLPML